MKKLVFSLLLTVLSPAYTFIAHAQDEASDTDEPLFAAPRTEAGAEFSLEELKMFARLFEQVRQNYVEEVSDSELLEMAIKGMLAQLDPHSEFLDKEKREFVENASEGSFYGVGLELTMDNGELTVVTPLDDSPAAKSDIKPGDVILEVDDQSVWGMSLNEALDIIDGDPTTDLKLLITREDKPKPFEIVLVREKISLESVRAKTLTHDIGYLRIRQFQRGTGAEFQEKLARLLSDHPYITGIILDLRNNPGGILQAAIEVSDAFLSKGLVVSTRGRAEQSALKFYASPETLAPVIPLVVLINQGSASASEIVAGALQDHKRAVIMGDISFGKGSVQNVVPIDEERGIKLTTARYYTPSGRSIQAQGIFPDVSVLNGNIERKESFFKISEANLPGHLENENGSAEGGAPELLGLRETLADIEDLQLAQALAFLKGLAIYQR